MSDKEETYYPSAKSSASILMTVFGHDGVHLITYQFDASIDVKVISLRCLSLERFFGVSRVGADTLSDPLDSSGVDADTLSNPLDSSGVGADFLRFLIVMSAHFDGGFGHAIRKNDR